MTRPRITDPDVIARFVEKIEFDENGCWKWKPAPEDDYGAFRTMTAQRTAHRAAYRIYNGPLPENSHVHHSCQNKWCVHPEHLEVMGAGEHMQMLAADGHKSHGNERSDGLDADTVREIRRRAENGEKQKDIAEDLDTTEPQVSRIVNRKTYDHID